MLNSLDQSNLYNTIPFRHKKKLFPVSVVEHWNRLHTEVVESPSVETHKIQVATGLAACSEQGGGTRHPTEEHSTSTGLAMKVGFFCLFSSFNNLQFFFFMEELKFYHHNMGLIFFSFGIIYLYQTVRLKCILKSSVDF